MSEQTKDKNREARTLVLSDDSAVRDLSLLPDSHTGNQQDQQDQQHDSSSCEDEQQHWI